MSVIKDLYEGQVSFAERANPGTLDYKEAKNLEESLYDAFYATLSAEQKVLYEAFEGARCEVDGMEQEERFRQGVKFGVRLMMEILG